MNKSYDKRVTPLCFLEYQIKGKKDLSSAKLEARKAPLVGALAPGVFGVLWIMQRFRFGVIFYAGGGENPVNLGALNYYSE